MTSNQIKKLRDEMGYKWALASAKHYHERIGRTNLLGEEIPFKNEPDQTTYAAYRAGFDAATTIYETELAKVAKREARLIVALEITKLLWLQVAGKGTAQAVDALPIINQALETYRAELSEGTEK